MVVIVTPPIFAANGIHFETKLFTDNSRLGLSPYLQLKVGVLYRAVSVDPSPLNYPSLSRLPFVVLAHWRLVD